MGSETGTTVHQMAAEYIKQRYNKPGNVYVGIVSRLDAMTSGVLVLARTSKAASRLVPQFSPDAKPGTKAEKTYLAIVEGQLGSPQGILRDFVRKDDDAKRMRVVSGELSDARAAQLRYKVIASDEEGSLIAVRLDTGRKHQIRLQFASRNHAIIGDRKYSSHQPFDQGIGLHSFRLSVNHPTRGERLSWTVNPPKSWKSRLREMSVGPEWQRRIDAIDWPSGDDAAEAAR